MIRDALLTPPKIPAEKLFTWALDGYVEELDTYLSDIENPEFSENLPESRDNLLSAHKKLAYETIDAKNTNYKERARLLAGWQVFAVSAINNKIAMSPVVIKSVEGPWNKEEFEPETEDPQAKLTKEIILAIHGSKSDPNRKSPSDSMKAADKIHEVFSLEVSMILYRLKDELESREDDTEEPISQPPTIGTPQEGSDALDELLAAEPEDFTRFLLGKTALDMDEDGLNTSDWDIEASPDTKD